MAEQSIWRLLFRFSGPTIISMMVAASYSVVDAIFVGRLGPEALAALAIVFPLMLIIHAIAAGTGTGAASLISRRLGAKDIEGANRGAGTTIGITILIGALITAVCLPNLEALLRLFGASGPILSLANDYMSILVSFAVVAVFPMAIGDIVRAEGNPMLPAIVMIVSAVTNIILDPVLIFGLGPIPAMGIAGAATATVIARAVGTIILIIYFISPRTSFRFRPIYFLPNLKILAKMYRVGVASIAQTAGGAITMVFVNRTAASFGFIPLAVLGVFFRAFTFIIMPSIGIGIGMLPLVGFNFGAKRTERVGEVVLKAGIACSIWGLLCWLAIMLFPTQIISLFNSDPNFLEIGTSAIRVFSLLLFAVGAQISANFFFLGIGKGLPALVLALSRQVIFLLPFIFILPRVFGLIGLWAAFPVADGLAILFTLFWTGVQFRKLGIPFRLRYSEPPSQKPV
jgi:putative MATE family efflux protein